MKRINTEINGMVKKKQRLEKDYLHIRRKRRMLKHEEEKIRKDVLLSADVICCTLNASGSALLHKLLKTARYESFLHQRCNSRGLGGTIVSFSFSDSRHSCEESVHAVPKFVAFLQVLRFSFTGISTGWVGISP